MSVRVFGWILSATLARIIARSGNMHTVPINPVKVIELFIVFGCQFEIRFGIVTQEKEIQGNKKSVHGI